MRATPDRRSDHPSPAPGRLVPSLDLAVQLAGFDFTPGEVNVRKIVGDDGREKYQLRLDLGLLQMESAGRPDGRLPHGFESLYDYHQDRLQTHRVRFGHTRGFLLSPDDCRELRDEASMYYHRYLSAFVLRDYALVVRDTRRNLATIEFVRQWAAEGHDRALFESYIPYVVMMQARASAGLATAGDDFRLAGKVVASALRRIGRHFRRHGGQAAYDASAEVRMLKKLSRRLRRSMPDTPVRLLRRKLRQAVEREHYEQAARIRDELAGLGADLGTMASC